MKTPRWLPAALAALLTLGVATAARPQAEPFDPEMLRRIAERLLDATGEELGKAAVPVTGDPGKVAGLRGDGMSSVIAIADASLTSEKIANIAQKLEPVAIVYFRNLQIRNEDGPIAADRLFTFELGEFTLHAVSIAVHFGDDHPRLEVYGKGEAPLFAVRCEAEKAVGGDIGLSVLERDQASRRATLKLILAQDWFTRLDFEPAN